MQQRRRLLLLQPAVCSLPSLPMYQVQVVLLIQPPLLYLHRSNNIIIISTMRKGRQRLPLVLPLRGRKREAGLIRWLLVRGSRTKKKDLSCQLQQRPRRAYPRLQRRPHRRQRTKQLSGLFPHLPVIPVTAMPSPSKARAPITSRADPRPCPRPALRSPRGHWNEVRGGRMRSCRRSPPPVTVSSKQPPPAHQAFNQHPVSHQIQSLRLLPPPLPSHRQSGSPPGVANSKSKSLNAVLDRLVSKDHCKTYIGN